MTQRTSQQNRAMWTFFQLLADALIERGVTMRDVYEQTQHFDVPPTKNNVHDLWTYFQKRLYGTESTKELEKKEQIENIHRVLMKNMGELFHIDYIPFPTNEQNEKEYLKSLDTMQ